MKLTGFKFIILGVFVMGIDSIYYAYYYYSIAGFSNPYSNTPAFSFVQLWKDYFTGTIGGVFTLAFIIFYAIGFYLFRIERKKIKQEIDRASEEFFKNIKKKKK